MRLTRADTIKAGVVGCGLVGQEIVRCLRESDLPLDWPPTVVATRGRRATIDGDSYQVRSISLEALADCQLTFFAGSEESGASRTYGFPLRDQGALVIDNSSAFRMHPDVPLVVPEVNPQSVSQNDRFVANPNCSTIQLVLALAPLHRAARLKRVLVSTYQSVSGWGRQAVEQLQQQTQRLVAGKQPQVNQKVIPRQIAFNVVPQVDKFLPNRYTAEEMKMVSETRKILDAPNLLISATCVRVPVYVGHAEAVTIETCDPLTADRAREVLGDPQSAPGVRVIDDIFAEDPHHRYPTPLDAAGGNEVLVGRIREDTTFDNGLSLWIVGDNLRKGAAHNAVQIAEMMYRRGFL